MGSPHNKRGPGTYPRPYSPGTFIALERWNLTLVLSKGNLVANSSFTW